MEYNIELSAERMRKERESMKCIVSRDENDSEIVTIAGDNNPNATTMTQGNLLTYMRQKQMDSVGRNKLSALENGDHKAFKSMTLSQWMAFSDVFGKSVDYLTGKEPYKTPTIRALCDVTGLSIPAAELLQEWKKDNPDWISHIDAIIKEPDFTNILKYMTALKGTAEFSADNYYRKKNFDEINNHLMQRLPGYKPPEMDDTTEKMHGVLVDLARKSDIHEIGRTMENIMDILYVRMIDEAFTRSE